MSGVKWQDRPLSSSFFSNHFGVAQLARLGLDGWRLMLRVGNTNGEQEVASWRKKWVKIGGATRREEFAFQLECVMCFPLLKIARQQQTCSKNQFGASRTMRAAEACPKVGAHNCAFEETLSPEVGTQLDWWSLSMHGHCSLRRLLTTTLNTKDNSL